MHVDELLRRPRRRQQSVAAGGHLAQARADDQQQVGVLHPLRQFRIDPHGDVAGVIRVAVVEQILEAESAHRGQAVRLDEPALSLIHISEPTRPY